MLKLYDLSELRYTNDPEIVIEGSRDYVRYDDIKNLIELNKKLLGKHSYTPSDIQKGIDFYEVQEVLEELESEILKVLEN